MNCWASTALARRLAEIGSPLKGHDPLEQTFLDARRTMLEAWRLMAESGRATQTAAQETAHAMELLIRFYKEPSREGEPARGQKPAKSA